MPATPLPLPNALPAKTRAIFTRLMEVLPIADIPPWQNRVKTYVSTVLAASDRTEFVDVALIKRMVDVSLKLLALYPKLPPEQQAWVIGAIRYFVLEEDANDDLHDPMGFDDDLAVLNSICSAIGREDLVITR